MFVKKQPQNLCRNLCKYDEITRYPNNCNQAWVIHDIWKGFHFCLFWFLHNLRLMGGIVLAIAQSWHQSWWIINIFSFNFSLSPISLYLFIINFICCEYLSYLRRSSLAFTHALVLSPSHNWESLGKTKRNACLHILMYFNCWETNMSRIHYKY